MTENKSPITESCKERALTIPKFREPYDVEGNRLCICKTGSGGEHRQELCNFVPILEAVYTYDDGADQKTVYRAFALKDVPTVLDDYHPCAPGEAERMKNTMQMVARAYGDRASRSRLSPNITLRPNKTPMGNAVVTAEFQPDITESGIARLFCVEMPAGAVDKKLLTDVQTAARKGALQRTMCVPSGRKNCRKKTEPSMPDLPRTSHASPSVLPC